MSQDPAITELLRAWGDGDAGSRDALIELIYEDLKRMAQRRIRGEAQVDTLDATGLAHEAYLRLIDQQRAQWQNRNQFFAIAAHVMRRILVDRHRARNAEKRGGAITRVALDRDVTAPAGGELDLEALNQALDRLALQDERQARIVELRFFGGLTIEETADVVGISVATLKREWAVARAWLKREMTG